jgi:hypothetical protein
LYNNEKDTELISGILIFRRLVSRHRVLIASGDRMRLRRTRCRHGDFQTKFLKIRKYRYYKQLILNNFSANCWFRLELFGTVWKYFEIYGHNWAQFLFLKIPREAD